jgi:hypothetical protein
VKRNRKPSQENIPRLNHAFNYPLRKPRLLADDPPIEDGRPVLARIIDQLLDCFSRPE